MQCFDKECYTEHELELLYRSTVYSFVIFYPIIYSRMQWRQTYTDNIADTHCKHQTKTSASCQGRDKNNHVNISIFSNISFL